MKVGPRQQPRSVTASDAKGAIVVTSSISDPQQEIGIRDDCFGVDPPSSTSMKRRGSKEGSEETSDFVSPNHRSGFSEPTYSSSRRYVQYVRRQVSDVIDTKVLLVV